MSAPVKGTKNQVREEHPLVLKIKEEIEMKLAKLHIGVSKALNIRNGAKLLGGMALGAVLATATALPLGSVQANHPASPSVNERAIPTDQFWGAYYERMMEVEGRWGMVSPRLAIGGGDDADEDGYFTPVSIKVTMLRPDDAEEDGYFTSDSAKLAPVTTSHDQLLGENGMVSRARVTDNVNFADEDGYFTPVSIKLTILGPDDAEEDGYF